MHQNHTQSISTWRSTAPVYRLLLVEDQDADALMIEQALQQETPAIDAHRARTIAEARRLLSDVEFEAVLVNYELPDGDCFDFFDMLVEAALLLPVVVLTQYGHEDVAVSAMKAGASDCIRKELDQRHLEALPVRLLEAMQRYEVGVQAAEQARRQDQKKIVDSLRMTVANVKHEINNPLAIISGNAQLLLELSRMMELDEDLVKPIRDIEEASLRISDSLDKLNSIKELIARDQLRGEENHNGLGYR